ncbi:MAG: UPF0158 family protein [Thermodesulfovibrionales bacterium]|nr:UPF0158 family protein [Thermodesulfovibrionales bacterium]
MKKLKVNFDEIQKAMEDVVRDNFDYFLDIATGEVIAFSEEMLEEAQSRLHVEDFDDMMDEIESIEFDELPDLPEYMEDEVEIILEILLDESGQYVRIPERPSSTAYTSMSLFIETVADPALKTKLLDALDGKGAFRNFKDVLVHYPKERKRWHSYNAKTIKKEINEWLHIIGANSLS